MEGTNMEAATSAAPAIRLEGLVKQFGAAGEAAAVAGIDLEIRDGECSCWTSRSARST